MTTSPARDAIVARTPGLPPELQSTSMLTWQGIAEVTDALQMPQDGLLLDVACGRGGYGIEVAGVPVHTARTPSGPPLAIGFCS
jgi:hypothetical protein